MPNHNVFCVVPWTNVHVYHDGSLGICCAESHKLYDKNDTNFNLKNMTLSEWYNQKPATEFRKDMFGDSLVSECSTCMYREELGFLSKRIRANYQTVIFTDKKHFDKSYTQSTGYKTFETSKVTGETSHTPFEWHIDFGNECNLACKMCRPEESSKIGAQYRQWNLIPVDSNIFNNWSDDDIAWNNLIRSFDEAHNLIKLHIMGGEPLMSKKFLEFIDYVISTGRNKYIELGFVTNATLITQAHIDKFKQFKTCNIEISLEALDKTNDYIRQGSNVDHTMKNVKMLLDNRTDKLKLVMRSVPQLLNATSYINYIRWCYDKQVSVDSLALKNPAYLQVQVLPKEIKERLIPRYTELLEFFTGLKTDTFTTIISGRNDTKIVQILEQEVNGMLRLLTAPEPPNVEELRYELVEWLQRWDKVYNLDALDYYPEYAEFLKHYGYI
jgi:organic radical activating enzyme